MAGGPDDRAPGGGPAVWDLPHGRKSLSAGRFAVLAWRRTLEEARAADARGCQGQATAYDTDGMPIDTAAAPGAGGTEDDPLDMMWDGTVEWSGSTEAVLQNGSYEVSFAPQGAGVVFSAFVKLVPRSAISGEVANDDGRTSAEGTVTPGDVVPVTLTTGTYRVEWSVTGQAGSCTGSGYVTITDNPMSSVTWWVALTLILLGFTGLLLARPTTVPGKG
jgi:hypothetical protein